MYDEYPKPGSPSLGPMLFASLETTRSTAPLPSHEATRSTNPLPWTDAEMMALT